MVFRCSASLRFLFSFHFLSSFCWRAFFDIQCHSFASRQKKRAKVIFIWFFHIFIWRCWALWRRRRWFDSSNTGRVRASQWIYWASVWMRCEDTEYARFCCRDGSDSIQIDVLFVKSICGYFSIPFWRCQLPPYNKWKKTLKWSLPSTASWVHWLLSHRKDTILTHSKRIRSIPSEPSTERCRRKVTVLDFLVILFSLHIDFNFNDGMIRAASFGFVVLVKQYSHEILSSGEIVCG